MITFVIFLLLALLFVVLELHMVTVHDDDWTTTQANIAQADFINGEDVVMKRSNVEPKLRNLLVIEAALSAVASNALGARSRARVDLQPNTWNDTQTISKMAPDVDGVPTQDTTATDFHTQPQEVIELDVVNGGHLGGLNVPLTENLNWINAGRSAVTGGNASATNVTSLLVEQYGSPVSKMPDDPFPQVVIRKSASVDVTADIYSAVIDEKLDDDDLDPDADYRLRWAMLEPEGALDSIALAFRMQAHDAKDNMFLGGLGCGPTFGPMVRNWYIEDSIVISGNDQLKVEALCDAASKPVITMAWDQIRGGSQITGGSGRSKKSPGQAARDVGAGARRRGAQIIRRG